MLSAVDIGRAIASARRRENLTQSELAALSGISERTLRDIENGTGRTSLQTVLPVAAAAGVALRLEDV